MDPLTTHCPGCPRQRTEAKVPFGSVPTTYGPPAADAIAPPLDRPASLRPRRHSAPEAAQGYLRLRATRPSRRLPARLGGSVSTDQGPVGTQERP